MIDLVGAQQTIVDALGHRGDRVGRVEGLVRVHLSGEIGIACDLPTRQIDGVEPGFDLLHRLVAGESAQGIDERLLMEILPQFAGGQRGDRVFDVDRASQPHDILGGVGTCDIPPAGIFPPITSKGRRSIRTRELVHSADLQLRT